MDELIKLVDKEYDAKFKARSQRIRYSPKRTRQKACRRPAMFLIHVRRVRRCHESPDTARTGTATGGEYQPRSKLARRTGGRGQVTRGPIEIPTA